MKNSIHGVILAGGKSERLGRDKALESFNGKPLISNVIYAISKHVNNISIVINENTRKKDLSFIGDVSFIVDKFKNAGSLGGIYSGLEKSPSQNIIVFACDMPFISGEIISFMKSNISPKHDIIIPETNGFKHSTHAIYSKNCLPIIKKQLIKKEYKISKIFDKCNTKILKEENINQIELNTKSFFNINYDTDLDKANQILSNE